MRQETFRPCGIDGRLNDIVRPIAVKLFISHAWDDKSFARPLVEALRTAGYGVWFDEAEFKAGDSLLGKINEGLLSCDYGIVIFSRTFFQKYWTKVELDGLMALERKYGKMVLPIWVGLSASDLTDLMPTFAGSYGIVADKGVDQVVVEICAAIEGAERQRELSRGASAKTRFQEMSADKKARREAALLLQSRMGVQLASAEARKLQDGAERVFSALSTEELPVKCVREGDVLEVQAPSRLRLQIRYMDGAFNTAENAELICAFVQLGRLGDFGERGEARLRDKICFRPCFDSSGTAVWSVSKDRIAAITTDALVEQLADSLVKLVEAEIG